MCLVIYIFPLYGAMLPLRGQHTLDHLYFQSLEGSDWSWFYIPHLAVTCHLFAVLYDRSGI